MAAVKVEFGGDSANKQYSHTDDILRDDSLARFLNFQKDRVSIFVRGVEYAGPLHDGDVVTLTTKQNTKGR